MTITYRELEEGRFEANINGTLLTLELNRERGYPGMPGSKRDGTPHLDMYRKAAGILGSGLTILDCACGSGYGSAFLAECGHLVSGADVAPVAVAFATHAYSGHHGATFVVADMVDLPYGSGSFDAVVSVEAIEHTKEPARALREFRRVLRPGGTLFITTPQGSEWKPWSPFHEWEARMDQFESMLSEAGFTEQKWWPSPTEWVVTCTKETR